MLDFDYQNKRKRGKTSKMKINDIENYSDYHNKRKGTSQGKEK